MKIAVICSNKVPTADLGKYLPQNTTEIISLCEQCLDEAAKEYIRANGITLTEYNQEAEKCEGRKSQKKMIAMIKKVDLVLVFWDGVSTATKLFIDECNENEIPIRVYV